MGGSVGGAVKNTFSNPVRGLTAIGTFGTSELARKLGPVPKRLAGLPEELSNSLLGTHYGDTGSPDVGGSGPFQLDANQLAANKAEILGLGNKQYADTVSGIDQNVAAQNQHAKDLFGFMLPDIAENAQAAHLYDSTGYGQEVARQQAQIASQTASDAANQRFSALSGRQGFETGALQRGLSLEDFINQANVAKTIGAQMAPQPPSGKQNFGTVAQGAGALAPFAKLGKTAATAAAV